MTLDEENALERFRQDATRVFYEALKLNYKGQAVEVRFEPPGPFVLPVLTSVGPPMKEIEPHTIDVRKLVADVLPGLWGYVDAAIGPSRAEACKRCGKVFEMNERREALS